MEATLSSINWKKVIITLLIIALVLWLISMFLKSYNKKEAVHKRLKAIVQSDEPTFGSPDLPETMKYSEVEQAIMEAYKEQTAPATVATTETVTTETVTA